MNETSVADVYPDVAGFPTDVEKQKITPAERLPIDASGCFLLILGGSWHLYPGLLVGVVHQAATIETARTAAAVSIRCSQHRKRGIGNPITRCGNGIDTR